MQLGQKFEVELNAYKAVIGTIETLEALRHYTANRNSFATELARTVRQAVEDIRENRGGKFPGMEGRVLKAVQHECELHRDSYHGDPNRLAEYLTGHILTRFCLKLGEGKKWSNS